MPKEIKIVFSLICFSIVATLIIASLSDFDMIQAAVCLAINGFIFFALFTIKFHSAKKEADLQNSIKQFNAQIAEQYPVTESEKSEKNNNNNKNQPQPQTQEQVQTPTQNNDNVIQVQTIPDGYVHYSVLPGYEISFTPEGNPQALIKNFIHSAKSELFVAEFNLNNNRTLIDELVSVKRAGIDTRLLVDYKQNSSNSALELLQLAESVNIQVYRCTNFPAMRHQFMIADGTEILVGDSFNIDLKSANSLLVFKNAGSMVDNYRNEFLRIANAPQNASFMCSDVGCAEIGIITWKNNENSDYHWSCSKYDNQNAMCKSCELIGDERNLQRLHKGKIVNVNEIGCDHPNETITWVSKWGSQEQGQFNQYWSCSGHETNDEMCKRCTIKGNEATPQRSVQLRAGDKCPLCKNGVLKMRRDHFGQYVLGCGNYPACKYPEGWDENKTTK